MSSSDNRGVGLNIKSLSIAAATAQNVSGDNSRSHTDRDLSPNNRQDEAVQTLISRPRTPNGVLFTTSATATTTTTSGSLSSLNVSASQRRHSAMRARRVSDPTVPARLAALHSADSTDVVRQVILSSAGARPMTAPRSPNTLAMYPGRVSLQLFDPPLDPTSDQFQHPKATLWNSTLASLNVLKDPMNGVKVRGPRFPSSLCFCLNIPSFFFCCRFFDRAWWNSLLHPLHHQLIVYHDPRASITTWNNEMVPRSRPCSVVLLQLAP